MNIRNNFIWNILGFGAPLMAAYFAIPLLIRNIGHESFGILTLIMGIIGYFSVFELGIGRALTQSISIQLSENKEIKYHLSTGLIISFVSGCIGSLLLIVFSKNIINSWVNISESLSNDAHWAIILAAIGVPIATTTSALRGVMEAHNDFKWSNIYRLILGISNFIFPVISVSFGFANIYEITFSILTGRFIVFFIMVLSFLKVYKDSYGVNYFSLEKTKVLIKYAGWLSLSNIIGPLMLYFDRFVIASLLGAGVVAFYTVPYEVLSKFLIIPIALTSVLFPMLAKSINLNDYDGDKIYKKYYIVNVFFSLILLGAFALFCDYIFSYWIDSDFSENATPIAVILCIGIFFNSVASFPFTYLQAMGHSKKTSLIHLAEVIIYMPILYFSIEKYNLIGAAFAWSFRTFLDLIILEIVKKFSIKK